MAFPQRQGPVTHVLAVWSGGQHPTLIHTNRDDGGGGKETGQPGSGTGTWANHQEYELDMMTSAI